MASGTESIPKVDKIYGPGNIYVTEAKKIISQDVAIDMPAGPSEVFVVGNDKLTVIDFSFCFAFCLFNPIF